MSRILKRICESQKDVEYSDVDPCYQEISEEKPRKLGEKTWISLGNRQFFVEDVQSIYIQAHHLIINFDYTMQQIVIYFGRTEKGLENAQKVFDILAEMYGAYKINIPPDAIVNPDIMETVYKDKVDQAIQSSIRMESQKLKLRHQKKLNKALNEIKILKELLGK